MIHGCLALFSGLLASCSAAETHRTSERIGNFISFHSAQAAVTAVKFTLHDVLSSTSGNYCKLL